MIKMRKTWMLTSALLLAAACGDDDDAYSPDTPRDGSVPDASTPTDSSVPTNIDAGTDASLDATIQDANTPTDAAPSDAGPVAAAIALVGRWHDDDYGGELEVTETKYGSQTLIEYDNSARVGYTQSPADDMYSPNKFNKIVWTAVTSAGFYQCTQDYGKDTLEAAKATTMKADPSDPGNKGCGNGDFPWTHYVPAIELSGSWQSGGAAFAVDSDSFGAYAVVSYDNAGDKAVLSTGGGDAGAATFSKVVWTTAAGPNRVYYCIVATGLSTEAEALASTATADVSLPTTGCNGAAWTGLTK
ncbi:MAG: hypothetical protein ABW352_03250 [Polyangiales bacterium]